MASSYGGLVNWIIHWGGHSGPKKGLGVMAEVKDMCPKCKGQGGLEGDYQCPDCNGTGEVELMDIDGVDDRRDDSGKYEDT